MQKHKIICLAHEDPNNKNRRKTKTGEESAVGKRKTENPYKVNRRRSTKKSKKKKKKA